MRALVVGLQHGLLHHADAVAVHHLLQHVEDLLGAGALEGKDPWGRNTRRHKGGVSARSLAGGTPPPPPPGGDSGYGRIGHTETHHFTGVATPYGVN